MNLLFICRLNKMRSRTAENVYSEYKEYNVKSAGLSKSAPTKLTPELLNWSDLIFVMEEEHEEELRTRFPDETRYREIFILDISDCFYFMEPKLIKMIQSRVDAILKDHQEN